MIKKKSKYFLLLILTLLISLISNAQNIVPLSLNSGGGTMTQSNGSLNFTVGELIVLTQTDILGNTLNGSSTFASTMTTVSIQEPDQDILNVNVFPNPTTELVNIQFNHSTLEKVIVSISDIQGKVVDTGIYTTKSNTINVNTTTYPCGTYILSLKNTNNGVLGTYKIIKQ